MHSKEESTGVKTRVVNAILRKIEGVRDLKRRLDYLMTPATLETSSRLSDMQVQGINECCWLGQNFDTLKSLEEFARGFATWRISLEGRGREEAISMIMASEKKGMLEGLGIHVYGEGKEKGKSKK